MATLVERMSPGLTEAQLKRAEALEWYHAYDFGSHQTIGRLPPPLPANVTLFGVMQILERIDVSGMRCLEVGPAHGLISIGLAMRGAKVTAIDIGGLKPPQIVLAEQVFGVEIDYRPTVALADTTATFQPASFDLIVCAGVMYHLLNPSDVFVRLRPLLKRNGFLLVESAVAAKVKEPVLVLNTETGMFAEPTTYFLPSTSVIQGLARLTCLDILATRFSIPSRYTLLGRAVLPDEVRDRAEQCKKVHAFGISDPIFRFGMIANAPSSGIAYRGKEGHAVIDTQLYVPDFPPHPKNIANPIGRRASGSTLKRTIGRQNVAEAPGDSLDGVRNPAR